MGAGRWRGRSRQRARQGEGTRAAAQTAARRRLSRALRLHTPDCPRLRTAARRAATIGALAVLAAAAVPQAALADGDPASDVLLGQNVFLPTDADAVPAQQTRLQATLDAAARSGFPIRVAVIASPADLGSVTALWRQPQLYARFLDQELSLVYRGPLLIVMPNGVGVASAAQLSAAERSAVRGGDTPIARPQLAAVAQTAAESLAAAAHHPISNSQLASATAPHMASSSAIGPIAILVLALGAALIAVAWAASLRARPPQLVTRRRARG